MKSDEIEKAYIFYLSSPALAWHPAVCVCTEVVGESERIRVAGGHFSDVFFVDAQHGWIVGSNSTILHTTDGGMTWNRQPSQPLPFDIMLKKVRFINPQTGWVVGDDGTWS